MFTMKKFAMLAVAGFLASSMFACTEEGEDSEDPDVTPPSGSVWTVSDISGKGWTLKTSVTLGSASHATLGSFLDVDGDITSGGSGAPIVYLSAAAKDNKDDIDLIYDGTNLWTPAGCAKSCESSVLKNAVSGSASEAALYKVSNVSPSSDAKVIAAAANAAAASSSNIVNNVAVKAKGVYYLKTSVNADALILVGKQGTDDIEIIVGYIYDIDEL